MPIREVLINVDSFKVNKHICSPWVNQRFIETFPVKAFLPKAGLFDHEDRSLWTRLCIRVTKPANASLGLELKDKSYPIAKLIPAIYKWQTENRPNLDQNMGFKTIYRTENTIADSYRSSLKMRMATAAIFYAASFYRAPSLHLTSTLLSLCNMENYAIPFGRISFAVTLSVALLASTKLLTTYFGEGNALRASEEFFILLMAMDQKLSDAAFKKTEGSILDLGVFGFHFGPDAPFAPSPKPKDK
jgi:hypothetical protein